MNLIGSAIVVSISEFEDCAISLWYLKLSFVWLL